MKQGSRAERRHHRARLKLARAAHWGYSEKSARTIGILARTSALCSCAMCVNARVGNDWESLTIQERCNINKMQDEIQET